ncbi:uncharacterized protein B0I36DRAFT_245480 [Microdochium trichocladiopsis]|uniref:Serum paraoxonase/arylesterase family protein n=1 Tax=Microdochium trichocladiopsis TaxID=1682393 RepID=A0A9P9BPS2_9PEZI|nr:uncharacterized protein B0I36DRAFT_245480 [Microdochium trichocladiopsis]KAH7029532.1 hypothetical protein B0I36DRAFT_245480 [Microdochium trichocladiopsis]
MARAALLVGLLSVPLGYIATTYGPGIARGVTVLGITRTPVAGVYESVVTLEETGVCEDLAYHADSGLIFTACEQSLESRLSWFPPLVHFDTAGVDKSEGALFVIDPKTRTAERVNIVHYKGPFITHGIDVVTDTEWDKDDGSSAVYIIAINHLPNPHYLSALAKGASTAGIPKARSQIEVLHYIIGSSIARHMRSVWDPAVVTPNDVVAVGGSPNELLVTNDHFHREGRLRSVEELWFGAAWTSTVYLRTVPGKEVGGVTASVATEKLHNNNGIGHGRPGTSEIAITSCASGRLRLGNVVKASSSSSSSSSSAKVVNFTEVVEFDSVIDNPSYFSDPYGDLSGWILPGLSRAVDLKKTFGDPAGVDPSIVWYARKDTRTGEWVKKVLFEDDGSRIRSASGAVLVAIDPKEEGGKRKGWLYVTGFVSSHVIVVKVDL